MTLPCGFALLILGPTCLCAQAPGLSSISGRVIDPSGATVRNARITLAPERGGPELAGSTNSAGEYTFTNLPPGNYELRVMAQGFAPAVATGVRAEVSRAVRQDVQLELARVETTVYVSTETALLNTDDSSIGNVVSGDIIQRLPNGSRDITLIFRRQPGIHQRGETNGARYDQNSLVLDGADVSSAGGAPFYAPIAVPAEVVAEVRVVVSNPVPSLNRGSGAQFSMETKRGGNDFHGSAYRYLQDETLNANRWDSNRIGEARSPYRMHRGGASAGLPVRRDKTFLFSAFEAARSASSALLSAIVPSDSLRQGLFRFRDAAGEVRAINPLEFDPRGLGANTEILNFLRSYPLGNDPTGEGADGLNTNGYSFSAALPYQSGFGLLRLDHAFNSRWRFDGSGRLSQNDSTLPAQIDLNTRRATRSMNNYGRFVTGAITGILSPNASNRTQFSWMHDRWFNGGQPAAVFEPTGMGADLAGGFLSEPISTGNALRWQRGRTDHFTVTTHLDYQRGRHRLQVGASLRRLNVLDSRNNKFAAAFTSPMAAVGEAQVFAVPAHQRPSFLQPFDIRRYDVFYSTLLGIVDSVNFLAVRDGSLLPLPAGTPLATSSHLYESNLFFQDVWRVTPSLTVSYGVAYGWAMPAREDDGRQVMAVFTGSGELVDPHAFLARKASEAAAGRAYNPEIGFAPVKALGRRTIFDTDFSNWSPRLSVAWNPHLFGSRDMVIRGGYGLLYDRTVIATMITAPAFGYGFGEGQSYAVRNTQGLPFRVGVDWPLPLPSFAPATSPMMPSASAPETISYSLDPRIRTPRNHVLNFSIQRALPWKSTVEIAYAGRLGRRLYQRVNLNAFPYMFRDVASGQTFAQAYDALAGELRAGVAAAAVTHQPWFENQLPGRGTRYVAAQRSADIMFGNLSDFGLFFLNDLVASPLQNRRVRDIGFHTSVGRANYHGLILTWNKRTSHGLSMTANYTYSKSLDQYGVAQEDASYASDSFNLDRDYGPSAFDHRHLFSTMFLYTLPFRGGHLSSGWWISGTTFANSGEPMSVVAAWQGFGGGSFAPQETAAIPVVAPQFDNSTHHTGGSGGVGTAAASSTGLNRFGDPEKVYRGFRYPLLSADGRSGRGALRDFINWNVDLAFGKATRIRESWRVNVSAELLNAMNHVIWLNPSLSLADPAQFGVMRRQWNSPRVIQMGLRVEW
jgi:hypothetical protein